MATDRKHINLTPPVKDRWDAYKKDLQGREGRSATDDEMVGAFLHSVPLWQADLMIGAYLRSSQHQTEDQIGSDG
jgi:hypothetical protein